MWVKKDREAELKHYVIKATAKQFLEDLGQKGESEKFFKKNDVYNMTMPASTEEMAENIEKKYLGKNLLKEIALFSGC